MAIYGVLNAPMFAFEATPGEHVDWSRPDLFSEEDFTALGLGTPEEYAEANPHMIVFLFAHHQCRHCGAALEGSGRAFPVWVDALSGDDGGTYDYCPELRVCGGHQP